MRRDMTLEAMAQEAAWGREDRVRLILADYLDDAGKHALAAAVRGPGRWREKCLAQWLPDAGGLVVMIGPGGPAYYPPGGGGTP